MYIKSLKIHYFLNNITVKSKLYTIVINLKHGDETDYVNGIISEHFVHRVVFNRQSINYQSSGKMYRLVNLSSPKSVNVYSDLRTHYRECANASHINKTNYL